MKSKVWKGQECKYAHIKRDGHQLQIDCSKPLPRFLTRKPTDITDELKWCGWALPFYERVPRGHRIVGELYVPGEKASYVKTAIKQRDKRLTFEAFAVPSMPQLTSLEDVELMLTKWGVGFIPYVLTDALESIFDILDVLPPDVEGYVLKNEHLGTWYKYKPKCTIDLIVHDVKWAERGKFLGLVGSLVCKTTEGIIVANVSGMDDATRVYLDESCIGRVCEVSYQYVGSQGKLRHPVFERWRDDKSASECGLEQDEELERMWNARNEQSR